MTRRSCERCGRAGILLPICGPCQQDLVLEAERPLSDPRINHGTNGGYAYWGCYCRPCRQAHVAYVTEWRERKRAS